MDWVRANPTGTNVNEALGLREDCVKFGLKNNTALIKLDRRCDLIIHLAMGMVLYLSAVDETSLKDLLAKPALVHDLVEKAYDDNDTCFDFDKSWHGLHYLLTEGEANNNMPWSFILDGHDLVGTEDLGYGPARAIQPDVVSDIAVALAGLSEEELRTRFDGAAMSQAGIYPDIWDRDPTEDDTLGYLLEYFKTLLLFLNKSAKAEQGLVVWMS